MGLDKLDWLGSEGISGWLGELVKERKETNKILIELVISIKAFLIGGALKKEDKVEKSVDGGPRVATPSTSDKPTDTDSKALTEIKSVNAITEEVLMDLTNVTIMALTEKALLVSKQGYQKWVPKSTISGVDYEEEYLNELTFLKRGLYLNNIQLNKKGDSWLHDKPWEKLEVRKG